MDKRILIHRRCACGCGAITNLGKRYICGHNPPIFSKETRQKISLAQMGNRYSLGYKHSKKARHRMSLAGKEKKLSKDHKLKISLSHLKLKYDPNYEYCDEWKDKEYRDDLRKDYCENAECKGNYKEFHNHHINLNKKDCRPCNVMTLCNSCHSLLHHKLGHTTNHKDYLTIIRKDRITYIHKETRKQTGFKRIINDQRRENNGIRCRTL